MGKRIVWYVGLGEEGTVENVTALRASKLDEAYSLVAKLYGGYTANVNFGGWWDPEEGRLVKEPSLRIEALTSDPSYSKILEARGVAMRLASIFNQKEVIFTVDDGVDIFKYPKQKERKVA